MLHAGTNALTPGVISPINPNVTGKRENRPLSASAIIKRTPNVLLMATSITMPMGPARAPTPAPTTAQYAALMAPDTTLPDAFQQIVAPAIPPTAPPPTGVRVARPRKTIKKRNCSKSISAANPRRAIFMGYPLLYSGFCLLLAQCQHLARVRGDDLVLGI